MIARALLFAFVFATIGAPRAEALLCHPLLGCSCTVTATDIAFGGLTPLSGAPQYATGEAVVDCTGVIDLAPSVAVKLSSGQGASYATRQLRAAGADAIDYNIYTTSQHNVVWGDGTGGSASVAVSGGLLSLGHWNVSRTMHARATPSPTAQPGVYTDSIVVRIDW